MAELINHPIRFGTGLLFTSGLVYMALSVSNCERITKFGISLAASAGLTLFNATIKATTNLHTTPAQSLQSLNDLATTPNL